MEICFLLSRVACSVRWVPRHRKLRITISLIAYFIVQKHLRGECYDLEGHRGWESEDFKKLSSLRKNRNDNALELACVLKFVCDGCPQAQTPIALRAEKKHAAQLAAQVNGRWNVDRLIIRYTPSLRAQPRHLLRTHPLQRGPGHFQ